MPLTSCFRCEAQISDAAASCPHCGLPQPAEHALHKEKIAEAERLWAAIAAGPGPLPALTCPECGAEGLLEKATSDHSGARLLPTCGNCGAPRLPLPSRWAVVRVSEGTQDEEPREEEGRRCKAPKGGLPSQAQRAKVTETVRHQRGEARLVETGHQLPQKTGGHLRVARRGPKAPGLPGEPVRRP